MATIREKGFTLIELMAVVAILSILLVVALAAYQDYVIRSKVSEGLVFGAEAKTAVSEYFYNLKDWPPDNQSAGLPLPGNYSRYDYLRRLEITNLPRRGTIAITFDLPGTTADGRELQLIPSTQNEIITWTCISPAANALKPSHVPPVCRG